MNTKTCSKSCSMGNNTFLDLVNWKQPIKSMKVFGGLLIILYLIKNINLIKNLFWVGYISLLILSFTEFLTKKFTNDGIISRYKIDCDDYKDCFTKSIMPNMNHIFLCFFKCIQKIFLVEDLKFSLKAAGVLYILYKLTSWFSLISLLFFFVIILFTVPFFYSQYKKEIDRSILMIYDSMKKNIIQNKDLVEKKLQPYINKFAKKVKPMCSKSCKINSEDTNSKGKDNQPSQNFIGTQSNSETFEKKKIY